MVTSSVLPRLLFLATEHRPHLPSKKLLKFVPQGDILAEASAHGLSGITAQFSIPMSQLKQMWEGGRDAGGGVGSADEFRMIAAQVLSSELELRRDELNLQEWLSAVAETNEYLNNAQQAIIEHAEVGLCDEPIGNPLPKWESGFEPLDIVLGGCYQGIVTVMATSGDGKTSFMMTLMEELRRSGQADELWFYETEIPLKMMQWRLQATRRRIKFKPEDRLICGSITSKEILQRVLDNPNPDRVVFVDSPDVMASGDKDGRRYAIEAIYRDLVQIKEKSKMVVVASQARRGEGKMSIESVSEAWMKVHYSDILLSLKKQEKTVGNSNLAIVTAHKNRFGIADQYVTFQYNYADLSWNMDDSQRKNLSNGISEEDDW